ncbi:MAG: hypothetical protein Q8M16_11300 [Pirellulaceae bacterium]|nr:hypothetical protein [Pirellulaceae bacterium]
MLGQTEIDLGQLISGLDYLLSWIGMGCLVGLIASGFLSQRQSGGSISTVVIAIAGTLLGCGLLQYFDPGMNIRPLSPQGLVVGTTGALLLLLFFGLLGGYLPSDVADGSPSARRQRRRRVHRQYLQED